MMVEVYWRDIDYYKSQSGFLTNSDAVNIPHRYYKGVACDNAKFFFLPA